MTLAEFKAWLDGFNEAIEGSPTPDQWAKIKAKMAETEAFVVPNQRPSVFTAAPIVPGPFYRQYTGTPPSMDLGYTTCKADQ